MNEINSICSANASKFRLQIPVTFKYTWKIFPLNPGNKNIPFHLLWHNLKHISFRFLFPSQNIVTLWGKNDLKMSSSPSFNNGCILGNVLSLLHHLTQQYDFVFKKLTWINLRTEKNNAKLLYHASGIFFLTHFSLCGSI